MPLEHGYKAEYDYVELMVEPWEEHWRLTLRDNRYREEVVHEEEFPTAGEAKDAALALAEHHINVQHNDTLLLPAHLVWQEY